MKLFDKLRSDKITSIVEIAPRTTEMQLVTASRGARTVTFNLSVDEIEDVLAAEDARRKADH